MGTNANQRLFYDYAGNFIDAYKILGLKYGASTEEISKNGNDLMTIYGSENKEVDKEVAKKIYEDVEYALFLLTIFKEEYDAEYKKVIMGHVPTPEPVESSNDSRMFDTEITLATFYRDGRDGEFLDFYEMLALDPAAPASKTDIEKAFNARLDENAVKDDDPETVKDTKRKMLVDLTLAYRVLDQAKDFYDSVYDKEMNQPVTTDSFYDESGKIKDFYGMLGISRDAGETDIHIAYLRIPYPAKEIRVAYKVLTNLRDVYNMKLDEELNKKAAESQEETPLTIDDFYKEGLLINFYEVLDIPSGASDRLIEEAYQKNITFGHKDKDAVRLAYRVLTECRDTYDRECNINKMICDVYYRDDTIDPNDFYENGNLIDFYGNFGLKEDAHFNEIADTFKKFMRDVTIQPDDTNDIISDKIKKEREIIKTFYALTMGRALYDQELAKLKGGSNMNPSQNRPFGAPTPTLEEMEQMRKEQERRNALSDTTPITPDMYTYNGQILDFYNAFGLNENATEAQIDAAFDVAIANEIDEDVKSQIRTAYRILKTARDGYDAALELAKNPNPNPNPFEDYEAAEAAAREAFERAEQARIAAQKNLADAEAASKKAESESAKAAADNAKKAAETEKEKKKAAAKKVREENKTARAKKKEAKKAERAAKKAEKKADKIAKSTKKRKVLVKSRKGGKLMAPIRFVGEHWKGFVAGGVAAVTVTASAFAIKYFIDNADLKQPDNNKPGTTQVDPSTPTSDSMQTDANKVHDNWQNIGTDYTKEDIEDLVDFTQGGDASTIDVETADSMIEEILNEAMTPAINNALAGEKVFDVQPIVVSSLLPESDTALTGVKTMEDYLNALIEGTDIDSTAKKALEDEIRVALLNETVNGFDLNSSSPMAKIIWSRLAIAINGITGTLGEDFTVEVDGTPYSHNEINNAAIFEVIINGAKNELGNAAKTMTK